MSLFDLLQYQHQAAYFSLRVFEGEGRGSFLHWQGLHRGGRQEASCQFQFIIIYIIIILEKHVHQSWFVWVSADINLSM